MREAQEITLMLNVLLIPHVSGVEVSLVLSL